MPTPSSDPAERTDRSPVARTDRAAPGRRRLRRVVIGTTAGLAVAVVLWLTARPPAPAFHATDVTGALPDADFRLTDAEGRPASLASFRGKVVMLFFGFTQCPDVCPTALARAADVRARLGPLGDRLKVVFVTIDPERDTPEVLGAYVHSFDPDVVALRGDARETEAAARAFRVIYMKVPTGSSYTMDHTATTFVIDGKGRLRLAVPHGQSGADVAQDLRKLIEDGDAR